MLSVFLTATLLASAYCAVLPNPTQNILGIPDPALGPSSGILPAPTVVGSFGPPSSDTVDDFVDAVKDAYKEPQSPLEVVSNVASAIQEAVSEVAEHAVDAALISLDPPETDTTVDQSVPDDLPGPVEEALDAMADGSIPDDANDDLLDDVDDVLEDIVENAGQDELSDDLGTDDIMDDIGEVETESDDVNDDSNEESDNMDGDDIDDNVDGDSSDDAASTRGKYDSSNSKNAALDHVLAFINTLKTEMGLQFDEDDFDDTYESHSDDAHENSYDGSDNDDDTLSDMLFKPNNDDARDDHDEADVYRFINKITKAEKYLDIIKSQAALNSASQSGTCPMYPVKISKDKVTIVTEHGCKIVIKLKGATVESVDGSDENLTDRQGLARSVEVSYETDN